MEKLQLCLGKPVRLLQEPLLQDAGLPPEIDQAVNDLIAEIQQLFVQVQTFEGEFSQGNDSGSREDSCMSFMSASMIGRDVEGTKATHWLQNRD